MAAKNFRSAFNGFNRQDVVHYIELLNNQHKAQIEQLNNQLAIANQKASAKDADLQAELDAALEKCAQLEAQLAAAPEKTEAVPTQEELEAQLAGSPIGSTEQELEAYRRAERAERIAQERAQQVCTQANAILADTAAKAEAAVAEVADLAGQANARLQAYQEAINGTQELFKNAIAALYAIKPDSEV